MNRMGKLLLILFIGSIFVYIHSNRNHNPSLTDLKSGNDAIALFPTSVAQIENATHEYLKQAQLQLDTILSIPAQKRSYENTIQPLDHLVSFSPAALHGAIVATFDLVHPDAKIRDAGRKTVITIQNFFIDKITSNYDLYQAIKNYADTNAKLEELTSDQRYFIEKTLNDYRKLGMDLPQDQREQVKKLQKDLIDIELEFERNIALDQTKVAVDAADLHGLDDAFVQCLEKNEKGQCLIGLDFPTFMQIRENCANAQIRKEVWQAYVNRAYPINKTLLETIIKKRHELANLLGFKTYAAYELSDQMVGNPTRAREFLNNIWDKAHAKAQKELYEFLGCLPDSIQLTENGQVNPWDFDYIKNQYKKKRFAIDNNLVAEYFPMEQTIDKLLSIYEKFLCLEFKRLPVAHLWYDDLYLVEVLNPQTKLSYGYLFLDLFPRADKFTHACQHTIIPATYDKDGNPNRGISIVIANFPKPQKDKPALLKLNDVNTFFHEFGHAIHALLGRTKITCFSGTSVKRDFVEMPSQMLEEWLWDPAILKMVSCHYKSGQPLSDDLIQMIIAARTFDSGYFISRQLLLANFSLELFDCDASVDIEQTQKTLFEKYLPAICYQSNDHFYAAFGHLIGYGARYYGYMWSSVFAHDLACQIRKEGFLNPDIGKKYVECIISKGGSKDPNDLLHDFLGRVPTQDAFLQDMGL